MANEDSSLAGQLADLAASSIADVVETKYVHDIHIDAAAGIYDCDCSGFVEYLLCIIALNHLRPLRDVGNKNPNNHAGRPLAHDFYTFCSGLPTTASSVDHGWRQITTLAETKRGDIVVWSLHDSDEPGDTGHVFIVAEQPTSLAGDDEDDEDDGSSSSFAVAVYDSSNIPHYADSRAHGQRYRDGIGSGVIRVDVDDASRPIGFQFNAGNKHHNQPIAIARIVPFSEG